MFKHLVQSAGGAGRNRTGVHGVAVRCMTTLPPRLVAKFFQLAADWVTPNSLNIRKLLLKLGAENVAQLAGIPVPNPRVGFYS